MKALSTNGIEASKQFAERKYYKNFVQPTLSSNGTIGGDSFAVQASAETTHSTAGGKAWNAFDNDSNTYWGSGGTGRTQSIIMYNPQGLRVDKITVTNWHNNRTATAGNVYSSNDGSNWVLSCYWKNSDSTGDSSWVVDVGSLGFYKYTKFETTAGNWDIQGYFAFNQITLTAVLQGTESDYDFYEDVYNYKVLS